MLQLKDFKQWWIPRLRFPRPESQGVVLGRNSKLPALDSHWSLDPALRWTWSNPLGWQ